MVPIKSSFLSINQIHPDPFILNHWKETIMAITISGKNLSLKYNEYSECPLLENAVLLNLLYVFI